jgi:cytochrome bd-type quinol oxidase subunit 2
MRKLQKKALRLYLVVSVFLVPTKAFAQVTDGLEVTAERAGYNQNVQIEQVVADLVNAVLGLLGVAFVVLLVYAGGLYLTARGDTGQVEKAQDLIRQAVTGMIIVSLSYVIANFVVGELITALGGGG